MEGDEKSAGGALAYWGLGAQPCDACGVKAARLYCRADAAFLCAGCDVQAHGAGSRSRHARVWLCEVCEHALGQPMAYNSMQELGIFSCLGNKCIFWTEAGYVGGFPSPETCC